MAPESHKCASPVCPGLPFKASEQSHPCPSAAVEFRCTRFDKYAHNCVGRDDVTARQGHYFDGASFEEAAEEMALRWPNDTVFDIQDMANPTEVVRFARTGRGMVRL